MEIRFWELRKIQLAKEFLHTFVCSFSIQLLKDYITGVFSKIRQTIQNENFCGIYIIFIIQKHMHYKYKRNKTYSSS